MNAYSKAYIVIVIMIIIGMILTTQSCNLSGHKEIDFNKQIRPILNNKCLVCHGGVKQQGDLSFLFPETAVLPAQSGKYAIVPGSSTKSELIHRIRHNNPELRMPLDADPLLEEEIDLLEQWIEEGAEWETHWAYLPISKDIEVPSTQSSWVSNEIDHFVLEELKMQELSPNDPATKSDLLRRVSLDLTGLPPTLSETKIFLTDESVDAYEQAVDRLLASKHFGERWAAMWLDLARYADSRGYQKDLLRPHMWRYRDWVIDAFNKDMPFDQFTIEQLAGDLIPDHTESQLLATAFHRNTMTNDEGGTDDEEFRVAAVIDRLNTTMEVWQGVTIGCVQCHSHPYDPIKHEEFYKLYAFFNNTEDTDHYSDKPNLMLHSPQQIATKQVWQQELLQLEKKGKMDSPSYKERLEKLMSIEPGKIPVMQELPSDSSRVTRIFDRGNWLVLGDTVQPNVPSNLPNLSDEYSTDRLGLAQWLTAPYNPLTARVMVNRLWEQIFGQGIVTTLEDFGTQSEPPSHPELLDWLASTYVNEYNWSTKSILKTIVMSSTYKQSSRLTADKLEKDPRNKYLSRGPRYRLSAEQIRDQALAISGLLNDKVSGESVMPHQPEGVWNVIRHVSSWKTSEDNDQYRRGLYTFWRRVSPYPSMLSFDTPTRELCVSRRIRTNTPLQALITLNDPVFVEAAEALAHRMSKEGGANLSDKINYAFQLALMRPIDESNLELLIDLYNKSKNNYNPKIHEDISVEQLGLIQVASVILNLDEVIMKT